MKNDITSSVWLGKCPREWRRTRIKHIAQMSPSFSNGKPAANDKCTVVPMEAVSEFGDINTDVQEEYQDVIQGLNLFENGDVLFAKITPCMENGKGAHVTNLPTHHAFGSTEFHVLRPSRKVDVKFLYYFTFNPTFRAWAEKNMHGAAGQQRVSANFLKYTHIPLPPLADQKRIAAYLDLSCAAIDHAVQTKDTQLKALEALRESMIRRAVTQGLNANVEQVETGVEWLGKIPSHWKLTRIKNIARFSPPFSNGKPQPNDLCTVVPMESVSELGEVDTGMVREFIDVRSGLNLFEAGDVLFAKITPCMENGKGAYIESLPTRYAFGSTEFHVMRPSHTIDGRFLYFFTLNSTFREWAQKNMYGAAGQQRVSTRFMKYSRIPIPPMREQKAISKHVAQTNALLLKVASNINKQIKTLTDYRKSLIHECVTGKRRISDADVAKVQAHV